MKPVSDAAEAMLKAAREWGVQPEHPEGAFIDSLANLLRAFEVELHSTRGLPMDKIEAAMRRAATVGMADAAKAFRHSQQRRTMAAICGAVAIALLAGGVAGYAAGYRVAWQAAALDAAELRAAFQSGRGGADWLADVVRNNDPAQLAAACRSSTYQTPNGEACRIQMWTGQRRSP